MSKRKRGDWRRLALILGLFIIAVVSPIIFNNPRITHKLSKIIPLVETAKRQLKFGINPNSTIALQANRDAVTQPLKPIRLTPALGPLRVDTANPRYFTDGSGKAIYLTGSHTWSNLQDNGLSDPPPVFDYDQYLDFLVSNNHNFFRLWVWEEAKWSTETTDDYWYNPLPYQRLGKEKALDDKPKFDLTQFNQNYFDRLRQRVIKAGQRGIYVSVMLFNGWSIQDKATVSNPWSGHPYHRDNNLNRIDGDPNHNGEGEETHTLQIPAVTALQEQYIRKVIDTVNDLDNVLYEISNESHNQSQDWQYHLIAYIKNYEATKPKHHPVGMTAIFPDGRNGDLFASQADWISPNGDLNSPPIADGRKVVLADSDHLCGICGDRQWVWKSFTRGENPLFMDVYDGAVVVTDSPIKSDQLNYKPWVSLRKNLGYTLTYGNRMNLAAMKPSNTLASTGYCLANPVGRGAEYLVYLPQEDTVIIDLSATEGELIAEWLNPDNGMTISGIRTTGGDNRAFTAPFKGDAVLYLKQS